MVSIIDNKSLVTGFVNSIHEDNGDRDFCLVNITVKNVRPLPGYPQLFHVPPGGRVTLNMRKDELPKSFQTGSVGKFKVKAGGNKLFFAEIAVRTSDKL